MPKKYKYKTYFTYEHKRYYVYADNKKDLYTKLANKKRDVEEGKNYITSSMPFVEWYKIYVDTYKTNCKYITLMNWKIKVEKQVVSQIGSMPLKLIKPLHCQNIAKNMEGYSEDYIKKIKQAMVSIFDKAVENKLMLENPAKYIILPKGTKTSRRSITDEERKYILETVNLEYRYKFYAVMLFCGLRPSEVANLKSEDIKDGMIQVKGTKTKNASRMVPIPSFLIEELNLEDEYVFTNNAGKKLNESSRQALWRSFKRQLNIKAGCEVYRNQLVEPLPISEDLVPYCLRHTYCTDLCKAGVDVRTAQRLMGHASITTTVNIYTHIETSQILDAQAKLDDYRNSLTGY